MSVSGFQLRSLNSSHRTLTASTTNWQISLLPKPFGIAISCFLYCIGKMKVGEIGNEKLVALVPSQPNGLRRLLLSLFVHPGTCHDTQVGVLEGFQGQVFAALFGLQPNLRKVIEEYSPLGAYRMVEQPI